MIENMKEKLKSRETKRVEKERKIAWEEKAKKYRENFNEREDTITIQITLKNFGFPKELPKCL